MDLLTTEEQQVEAIKKWWRENWASVIGGALIGIGIIVAGRMWMQNQTANTRAASSTFEAMMAAVNSGQKDVGLEFANNLVTQYAGSPYAAFAALASARVKLEAKDKDATRAHLQWALDNASQEEIKHVARIRLARLMLSEGQYAEALKLASVTSDGPFLGTYEEIKGDAYLGQQQPEQARAAYASAMQHLDPSAAMREIVQMKLDNLGAVDSAMQAGS